VALGGLSLVVPAAHGAISASAVVDYQPGTAPANFQNSSAALGLPRGDTGFGALTPFNPAFSANDVVIVGAGGGLTLRLSEPVAVGAGPEIGVFANNGLVDVSSDGSGTAGDPASTFSPLPAALVSLSADGLTFLPVGVGPTVFDNPTNAYTDVSIKNYFAAPGAQPADFAKPFTGSLSSFDGLTYPQIKDLLDGSGGGNFLDVSGTGLSQVQFVRFEVPAGADYRFVADAVTGVTPVPEPAAAGLLGVAGLAALRRRRRQRA
jgi:MYXO-CTERM domain-containing protein